MKKKLLKLAIFLVVFMMSIKTVYAEAAWPKEFTYGDFKYTIEGFHLNVYEMEEEQGETDNTDDLNNEGMLEKMLEDYYKPEGENNEETDEIPESMLNYFNDIPTKVIQLDPNDLTINPAYKNDKINQTNAIFAGMNLSLTKEKLESLLEDELLMASPTKEYLVELIVDYKLNTYPEKYTKIYNVNFFKDFAKLFINGDTSSIISFDTPEEETTTTNSSNQWSTLQEIDPSKTISQVINLIPITYDVDKDESQLFYTTNCADKDTDMSYYLNYLALLENEEDENPQLIMFHTVDDIDELIAAFREADEENPITSVETNDTVKVEDTSASIETYVYYGSIGLVIVGFVLIVATIIKNKKEKSYVE